MTILTNTNTVVQFGDSTFQITQRDLDYAFGVALVVASVYVVCRVGYLVSRRFTRQAQAHIHSMERAIEAREKCAKQGISVAS